MAQEDTDGKTRYVFEDMDRRVPLALWLGVTVLCVVLAGAWKGLRAVIGAVSYTHLTLPTKRIV